MYALLSITRQSHQQQLKREQLALHRSILYLHLIHQVRQHHPSMGLRTIYERFAPEGIGRDAFIALGINHGLLVVPIKGPRTTIAHPSAIYPNLCLNKELKGVNQLWSSDITYFAIGEKWYYLTFIMDVYSRRIIGYHADDNMRANSTVQALKMALDLRGIKGYKEDLIHHSDRGSQYISKVYTQLLSDYHIRISMCDNVLENAHIERINGIIKNKYLKYRSINNLQQLRKWLQKDVDAYNYDKPHGSLNKKTPVEFENFIKELNEKERPVLNIFTYQQNSEKINPTQLSFLFC